MKKILRFLRGASAAQMVAIVVALLMVAPSARAEDHVLSITELGKTAVDATSARAANSAEIDRFLANDSVKQVMKSHKIDESQVRKAVAVLNDDDLTRLAAKARSIESDLAAGRADLTDAQVTLFILGFFFLVFLAILVIAFK